MGNMVEYGARRTDLADVRGRLIGAALVAFGVIAFGAYSFAARGDQQAPALTKPVASAEVRTTPDAAAHQEMPPPVEAAKVR